MSVGAAAARGLESGFSMGLRGAQMRTDEEERQRRAQDQERQRAALDEERTYRRSRDAAADARLAKQDAKTTKQEERQARMDALRMTDSELADLQAEGQGMFTTYGGFDKVPQETRAEYAARVRETRGRRAKLRREFYEPDVQEQTKQAAETWSRIQAGQMSLEDVPDDDLVRTLTVQTRRPLTDFLRQQPDTPSPVEQAAMDVEAGMETGNRDLMIKGANVLLRPELSTGIGQEGPDGNEIVDKQLVDLAPHPQQPGQFVPIVEVTVKRDDGAVGKYRAPITEGRGVYANDPSQMPKAISVQDALDRVGQLGSLAKFVNQPGMRERLDRASPQAKASSDEFLQALGYAGVTEPKPAKISRERVDLGDRIVEREVDESGRIISTKDLPKRAPPKAGGGGGGGGLDVPPPPPRGLTGPAVLESLNEDDATIVEGLANGSIRPSEISTRGNRRERMLALAKRFDPAADFGPDGRLKEVPAAIRAASLENQTNLRRAERALRLVGGSVAKPGEKPDPEATGLKGYLPNQLLNRVDPDGVEARAAIADLGSLVIHSRSGAAVTAAEFPRLAPFIPSEKDDAETVKKKLRAFVTVYQEELQAMEQTYSKDNGYKGLSFGRDPSGVSGSWDDKPGDAAQPPVKNAKGWLLMTDAKGNRAYVSPDGQSFEEVR